MPSTIRAVFDGDVFRPEQPLNLDPDTTYLITIEREAPRDDAYPLTVIARLATDMGVDDLAAQHDRYAHGRIDDAGQRG